MYINKRFKKVIAKNKVKLSSCVEVSRLGPNVVDPNNIWKYGSRVINSRGSCLIINTSL